MKNLFVCIAAVFLSSNIACGLKLTRPEDVKTTAILAGMAAYEIGYTVGELENAEIDRAIQNAYRLAKTGQLDQNGMDQITDLISKKVPSRPTLPRNIMALLELVGVRFNIDGAAIGLDEIPPEIFSAIEKNYIDGLELYARQKRGQLSNDDIEKILSFKRDQKAELLARLKGGQ